MSDNSNDCSLICATQWAEDYRSFTSFNPYHRHIPMRKIMSVILARKLSTCQVSESRFKLTLACIRNHAVNSIPTASIGATVSGNEFLHSIWKWNQFNVFYSWLFRMSHSSYRLSSIETHLIHFITTFLCLSFGESSTSSSQLPSFQSPNFLFRNCKIVNSRFPLLPCGSLIFLKAA